MSRYRVSVTQKAYNYLSIWVEAKDADEAVDLAQEAWDDSGPAKFNLDDSETSRDMHLDDVEEDPPC